MGGGVIGVEFASVFSSFGCHVTIVEAMERILPTMDREISQSLNMVLKNAVSASTPERWSKSWSRTKTVWSATLPKRARHRLYRHSRFWLPSADVPTHRDCLQKDLKLPVNAAESSPMKTSAPAWIPSTPSAMSPPKSNLHIWQAHRASALSTSSPDKTAD